MNPSSPPEETEVIGRFLANPGADSYAALFRMMAPQVVGYFRARGCDPSLTEDLAQEVMLTVYTQNRQLKDRERFRPWLFRIARNARLQHARAAARRPQTKEIRDSVAPQADPLGAIQFQEWMDYLDPSEREAVLLRYVEGLEYHEIAHALDLPQGTVQWRIFQSIGKLAARFGPRPIKGKRATS